MEEKIYNTMKRSGGMNITLGILMIVFGLTAGVLMIVTGGRLLVKKADLLFQRLRLCIEEVICLPAEVIRTMARCRRLWD